MAFFPVSMGLGGPRRLAMQPKAFLSGCQIVKRCWWSGRHAFSRVPSAPAFAGSYRLLFKMSPSLL